VQKQTSMKKLIILLLIVCANINAQNDFLLKSYDRPIIEATINGNDCYLLIDTGSSLNIVDFSQLDDLGIKRSFKIGDAMSIAGGSVLWQIFQVPIIVKERTVNQFISSDLTVIRESILQSTGIKIAGIIGTPAIKELGMVIDLRRGIVTLSENITKSK
jgi:predicted aspartyl protease